MSKTPTVYDVAARAGVSIATVSFAFSRPDRVKESTRELVLAAARDLGYVPNASARGLAHGRTGALGLYSYDFLLPEARAATGDEDLSARLFPLYVDEVQRGVELACWERGFALMIGGGGPTSSGTVVTDIAGRVDGLAIFPQTVPPDVVEHIARRIPVVELSEPGADDGLDHVTVDNGGGTRQVTRHLIEEHGLRDLVFVGAVQSADVAARFKGFKAQLRAAGLPVPKRALSAPGDAASEAAALVEELDRRDGGFPEAIVCATDQQALALLDAVRAGGRRVPDDVAVTGFDGILAGRLSQPSLTTVRQPMEAMGRLVVELLAARLEEPGLPAVHRQLSVQLVLRESCGCPGQGAQR